MRPLSLLLFPQKRYPSDHAMLEEVYSKILPARGHRVTFAMQPYEGYEGPASVEWNGATVQLLPPVRLPFVDFLARRTVTPALDRWRSLQLAKELRPDVIQVRNEVAGALVAAHMQQWHRTPFVYQISFPTIEGTATAARLGLARLAPLQLVRSAALVRVQRQLMRIARLVLPISETMKDDLAAEGVPRERMVTFPLGADTSIDPATMDPAPVRRRHGLGSAPVVLYFGALDRLRGLEFLIEAFTTVFAHRPEARLVLLGNAANHRDVQALREKVSAVRLQEAVVFAGAAPRREVPQYLAAADVTVSPYPPLDIYRSVSPTKLMESLAMARPVVGNDVSEQGAIIRESGGGVVADYKPWAFGQAIFNVLKDPARAAEMGRRGREWVIANRSYPDLADRIEEAYAGLF
jgi:glycosyltransferase involved in cell wall biosynthesis